MDTFANLPDIRFLGNSLRDYAVCAVAIAVGLTLVKVFQILVVRRLRKWFARTPSAWDDMMVSTAEANAVPALYLLVVWLGLRDLALKEAVRDGLRVAVALAVTWFAVRVLLAVVNQAIQSYWQRHAVEKTEAKVKGLQGLTTLAKFLVCLLAAILLLDNLGFKISAFVAGLGVTGIAVALAAQTILGDLFGYFVIFFDQPFEVGHSIKVDNFTGDVEHIGLKTTRLRGADGEQIIFSNKYLTDSRIQNFRRMVRRRVVFGFEVDRATPAEMLKEIPGGVKALLSGAGDVTFERAHFIALGESGPRFEVSYVVETPDFNRHLDVKQDLNLGLYNFFQKRSIALAYPTRVVHLRQDGEAGSAQPAESAPAKSAAPSSGSSSPA